MQTTSQQHRSSPSAGFVPTSQASATLPPPLPPYTPSATTTAVLPLSATPRQRPGTSSGSAAVDGLVEPAPADHGPSFTDPFLDDAHPSSTRSTPRRPFAFGLGGGGGAESGTLFRKKSFARKPSLGDLPSSYSWQKHNPTHSLPPTVPRFKGFRRALSSTNLRGDALGAVPGFGAPPRTDTGNPPALPPEYALSSNPKLSISSSSGSRDHNNTSPRRTNPNSMESSRMPTRQGTMPLSGSMSGGAMMAPPSVMGMQSEAVMVHQHIQEMANKRISTLEYLRKAHEGRVHWFNTLLFDKPDLARMTYYDARRLARRATNYLLLGLSLPTVIDVNANSPIDFLRSLNLLLSEFDAFQSLHPENGSSASGLGRARIPNLNVFRRATPSKSRRSSSAATDVLYEDGAPSLPGTNGSIGGGGGVSSNISSSAGGTSIMNGLGGSASVVSFGQSEADLLPGEEYVHLLTPSLPFDPDFFETFATLCDVLIDAYTRLLGLLPTPRECNAAVAELFTKADARVRKIIVQGIVKEFEDTSRNGVRSEVANVGKIVLGGLM